MYLDENSHPFFRVLSLLEAETDPAKLRTAAANAARMTFVLMAILKGESGFEHQWANYDDEWFVGECSGSWEKCITWVNASPDRYHRQRLVVGHRMQRQYVVWPEEQFGNVAEGVER